MEHYMKVEDSNIAEKQNTNQEPFQIAVTEACKFYQAVKNAGKLLKEYQKVLIIGEGTTASKAIAIADKMKVIHKNVTENIDICNSEYRDVWIPLSSDLGLENLEVTRSVPTTKILIVFEEGADTPKTRINSNQQQQEQRHNDQKPKRRTPRHHKGKEGNTSKKSQTTKPKAPVANDEL